MGLHAKLVKIRSELANIPKNGYNDFHKYRYILAKDMVEAVRAKLVEHNIGFEASVIGYSRTGTLTAVQMQFTLVDAEADEPDVLISQWYGEGQDPGDKGVYKAYTGALKTWMEKTFLVVSDESDPESDTKTDLAAAAQAGPRTAPAAPRGVGPYPPKPAFDDSPERNQAVSAVFDVLRQWGANYGDPNPAEGNDASKAHRNALWRQFTPQGTPPFHKASLEQLGAFAEALRGKMQDDAAAAATQEIPF